MDDPETKDEVRSLFLKRGIDVSAATRCVRYTDELFFPDALEIIFLNPSVSATTPATGARIARCATRQSKDRKSPQTSSQILPIDDLSTAPSTPNPLRSRPVSASTPNPSRGSKHAVNPFFSKQHEEEEQQTLLTKRAFSLQDHKPGVKSRYVPMFPGKDRKSAILPIDDVSTAASTPNPSPNPSRRGSKHAVDPFSQFPTIIDF
jgi:hypothetical protein